MNMSSTFRSAAFAVIATAGVSLASAAHADSGTIRFSVYKAAFFVGGSGGEGTLTFHGRRYPVSVGGISGGPKRPRQFSFTTSYPCSTNVGIF